MTVVNGSDGTIPAMGEGGESYAALVDHELDTPRGPYITVDVEDYFHDIPGGEGIFAQEGLTSNLQAALEQLLDLFAEHGTLATFFVLACAAHRIRPQLERINGEGHEIASHGFGHIPATWISREEFREDLTRAKGTIEDIGGTRVSGYRAPRFSVTEQNLWALDEIRATGHLYDSSVCPVKNFAYGIPTAPERPHLLTNGLTEIPLSRVRMLGYRFMVSGGFYLRAYPFWFTRFLLSRRERSLPLVHYIHPWEWEDRKLNAWQVGVDHPALEWKPRRMRFINTYNRRAALDRFSRLLGEDANAPLRSMVPS